MAIDIEAGGYMNRRSLYLAFLAFVATLGPAQPQQVRAADVLVFAAASLKDALDAVKTDWQKESGKHATISYAASSALAKQIEAGAPADVFISADLDWMDYLDKKGLTWPGSRHDLLSNSLVLIAPGDSGAKLEIAPGFSLAKLLGDGRLAMADPNAVPAGKYGKAALQKLGVWEQVAGRVAAAANVRAALLLVARGEAPFGIVYKTDAAAEPKVKIIAAFPPDSVPPITYPIAVTAASKNLDATPFVTYLSSPAATKQFQKFGFTMLDEKR
ncbi:MAG TPA: molybdate ABC transporter substrate-binding protein [Stellaceae bacterium]|jgi:molybdate transport system substrate-binding protein|nr:molybdate ABC transporter substrate-binding protein [Stellaceae bacterium]